MKQFSSELSHSDQLVPDLIHAKHDRKVTNSLHHNCSLPSDFTQADLTQQHSTTSLIPLRSSECCATPRAESSLHPTIQTGISSALAIQIRLHALTSTEHSAQLTVSRTVRAMLSQLTPLSSADTDQIRSHTFTTVHSPQIVHTDQLRSPTLFSASSTNWEYIEVQSKKKIESTQAIETNNAEQSFKLKNYLCKLGINSNRERRIKLEITVLVQSGPKLKLLSSKYQTDRERKTARSRKLDLGCLFNSDSKPELFTATCRSALRQVNSVSCCFC
ncbi:hypothetical protein F511_38683 [Dorcoceras hygrometricum]|uniref:Uncharacterized protein n=1 Tax=Dorcoceras hygrometricum TaxID=472368 RepID=A0A2Z7C6F8_9LAMI|nr:hypothetical protein F511_38683 [Dorcoceras hygrometricum]